LDTIYEKGSIEEKRQVIGSIYPGKLGFDGAHLRTTRINEAVRIIYTLDKAFGENKNRTNGKFSNLSCQVGAARFEPATSCSQSRRDNRATLRPENMKPPAIRRHQTSYKLTKKNDNHKIRTQLEYKLSTYSIFHYAVS
jgi:hypothetical protein